MDYSSILMYQITIKPCALDTHYCPALHFTKIYNRSLPIFDCCDR